MGNGAKAQSKRERNAKDAKSAGGVSQLKANADAMNKKCTVCMQVFMQTTTKKILDEHASARHPGKTGKDCFGAVYDASKDAPAAK